MNNIRRHIGTSAITVFALLFTCGCSNSTKNSNNQKTYKNVPCEEYIENNVDWSNEELKQFYLRNGIIPTTTADEAKIVLRANDIENHLNTRFSNYTSWSVQTSESKDVASIYGANPIEQDENADFMQAGKAESKISDYNYIGCGNIALYSELEYLGNNLGYSQLIASKDSYTEKRDLCIDIFNTTTSYDDNSEIAQDLRLMDIEFESGTFIFPHNIISSAQQLFYDYNINNGVGPEELDSQGKQIELLNVHGDVIPNFSTVESKTSALIKSINNGMPVIWWTTYLAGGFSNHYMNIFGYETWKGVDAYGNEKTHIFFKLNMNWGQSVAYMDSDLLTGPTGGFIFFEEQLDKITINPNDYGFAQAYYMDERHSVLNINSETIDIRRRRTGYINEDGFAGTGDWFLTMSCKKADVIEAYISYKFSRPINYIFFDTRQWSSGDATNCDYYLQYKDKNGNWVNGINFFEEKPVSSFSHNKNSPEKYRYDFPYGVFEYRFIAESNSIVSSANNRGRIVIGRISTILASYKTNDPKLLVTVFSNDSNESSFMNYDGHAYIQVYNQSVEEQIIGSYSIPAFEGVTIGLWGNKQHIGVYYNIEYYLALTTAVDNATSSTTSSASSSSSVGSSVQSSGNQWSIGSVGAMKWLSKQVRQSMIVSYSTGRVSLTKEVELERSIEISNIINSHNDEWWPWYNCSHLATDVWNAIAPEAYISKDWIQTPKKLADRIKEIDGYQVDRCLIGDVNRVGYFNSKGFVQSYE